MPELSKIDWPDELEFMLRGLKPTTIRSRRFSPKEGLVGEACFNLQQKQEMNAVEGRLAVATIPGMGRIQVQLMSRNHHFPGYGPFIKTERHGADGPESFFIRYHFILHGPARPVGGDPASSVTL